MTTVEPLDGSLSPFLKWNGFVLYVLKALRLCKEVQFSFVPELHETSSFMLSETWNVQL